MQISEEGMPEIDNDIYELFHQVIWFDEIKKRMPVATPILAAVELESRTDETLWWFSE